MLCIRPATAADAEVIVELVRRLAAFEKAPAGTVELTPELVRQHGFGERPFFETLVAELDGRAVGMALFFHNFSTWEGKPGLYVEDLFVDAEARGEGVGRQLLAAVARVALERGCPRLEGCVLDWNPAREVYRHLGGAHQHEWMLYRVTGEALERLAASAVPDRDSGRG